MDEFSVRYGRCVLDDDAGELRLDTGVRPYVRRVWNHSRWWRSGLVVTLVGLLWLLVTAPVVVLAYLGIAVGSEGAKTLVRRLRGRGGDDRIALDAIERVETDDGGWLWDPSLDLYYEREGAHAKRRLDVPTPSFSYATDEYDRAWRLFDDRDIRVV